MRTFARNQKRPQQQASFTLKRSNTEASGVSHHTHPTLHLHRAIGNQAVQRLARATAEDHEGGSGTTAITRFAHDFSRIPVHRNVPVKAQPELTVNAPANVCEQAAHRTADQVVSMPAGSLPHSSFALALPHIQLTSATTGTAASDGMGDAEANFVKPDEAPGVEPLEGNLPGAPSACVVNAALPYSRSGILRSSTGTVGEQFEVRVEWSSAPAVSRGETSYCAAECGEYHQFIKGHLWSSAEKDGSNLTDVSGKVFGGLPLDANVFHEDGLDRNPKARYGHRKEPQTMDEEYKPNRTAGPKYFGRDFPNVSIGTFADIDLTFLGKLVDTCNGTESSSDPWRVQYRGVIRP